jgi:hypothetical protein
MVQKIKDAVEEITSISFAEFTGPGKKREKYFARLIFGFHLIKRVRIHYKEVAGIVNRNPSTVFRYPEFYKNELNCNPDFRRAARRIEEKLVKVYQSNTLTN